MMLLKVMVILMVMMVFIVRILMATAAMLISKIHVETVLMICRLDTKLSVHSHLELSPAH